MSVPQEYEPQLLAALADTPVVLINGARQTGKSTLARQLSESAHPAGHLTFDDASTLAAAEYDPPGFVAGLGGPVVIDEVQRAGVVPRPERGRRP